MKIETDRLCPARTFAGWPCEDNILCPWVVGRSIQRAFFLYLHVHWHLLGRWYFHLVYSGIDRLGRHCYIAGSLWMRKQFHELNSLTWRSYVGQDHISHSALPPRPGTPWLSLVLMTGSTSASTKRHELISFKSIKCLNLDLNKQSEQTDTTYKSVWIDAKEIYVEKMMSIFLNSTLEVIVRRYFLFFPSWTTVESVLIFPKE